MRTCRLLGPLIGLAFALCLTTCAPVAPIASAPHSTAIQAPMAATPEVEVTAIPTGVITVALATPSAPPAPPPLRTSASASVASEPFAFGVPAGDAYAPMSVAVDDLRGRAYVYHADSAEGRPVVSVVDLARAR